MRLIFPIAMHFINSSPTARRQAITGTNAGLLSIGTLETNLNEIRIKVQIFHSSKRIWKCSLLNGGHFMQGKTIEVSCGKVTLSVFIW